MPRRVPATIAGLALLLALAVLWRLMAGGSFREFQDVGQILSLRLHRIWSAAIVGSSLAVGGVLLQSLLRNPLASPDLIGPNAGAGLAIMFRAYLVSLSGGAAAVGAGAATSGLVQSGAAANAPAAFIGALAALLLVYTLSQRRGFVEPVSLILVGVIVGVVCGAATIFLGHLMPDGGYAVSRWTIGSLSDDTPRIALLTTSLLAAVCLTVALAFGRAMDVAALGDDEAQTAGVPIARLRLVLFILAGALTANAVVLAGPIGFVGLVCPHIVRLLAGVTHRPLLIGSALAGAALVIGADAAVKSVNLASGRMPIGVITALVGGPVFILLLRRDSARTT